jgi:hypothetical protein
VHVEHVARVGLAARRAAQQQRELAVGDGLLRQIVVDDERVAAALSRKYSAIVTPVYGAMNCSGAGSDGRRRRRRSVYSIAPVCGQRSTTVATVDCFWPIAT